MANIFDDPEMMEIFEGYLVETQELLENISNDLMTLEEEPENLDLINQVFRSFHTIKGTSSFMGFTHISHITHEAEDLLNKARRNELVITNEITDVLLEVHDWISLLIEDIKQGNDEKRDYTETINHIITLRDGKTPEPKIADSNTVQNAGTVSMVQNNIQEDKQTGSALDRVLENKDIASGSDDFNEDELAMLEAAFAEINSNFVDEVNSSKNVTETALKADTEAAADAITSKSEAQTPVAKPNVSTQQQVAPKQQTSNAPQGKAPATGNETIRIDVDRIESLMDLSGELVLGRNRLAQITSRIENVVESKDRVRDLIEATAQIDFVTSEIQTAVMRMRMVQVAKLYQKAPRIVRDLSKEFGKKIKLIVKGEETEIDRGIIEELNDPLVHMIRNSCDHGIEPTEERIAAGKPAEGIITLDAEQEGNHIVLRISDDGKGMDPDKLKTKAIEKGLITPEQAQTMTNREIFQLIFAPGFSTAKVVTAVSGRGVGMDVVRTNIQKLKGMIEIDSELGKGSTFIIKLPLTLAIIQGLLIKVKDETYAIPLSSVDEVVGVDEDKVYKVNQQEVIKIREEVYPLCKLDDVLNTPGPEKRKIYEKYVVIVGLGTHKIGLIVDELLGQQEIVIKSLGEYLGEVGGIAGATIMGDGRVIMIIDIADLIGKVFRTSDYIKFSA